MAIFGSSLFGFLIAVAILVTIHELGHYLAARWCGVKVLRFSVGFGPVLIKWIGKRSIFKGTEFAISAIPLGGYVRMLDMRDPECRACERSRPMEWPKSRIPCLQKYCADRRAHV